MQHATKDLLTNINHPDKYAEILSKLLFDGDEPPKVIFKKLSNLRNHSSIIFPILKDNQHELLHTLYDHIQLHKYTSVVRDVIWLGSIVYWDLMVERGFEFDVESYHLYEFKNILGVHEKLIEHLLNLYHNNNTFIFLILTDAIQKENYQIIEFILDKLDQYQISLAELNKKLYELFTSGQVWLNEKLYNMFEPYGFILDDKISNEMALSILNEVDTNFLNFLIKRGVDLNEIVKNI